MVLDAVSNFVRGESDAAIDDTQTTVSVVDASIFPDPSVDGEYNVVIWDAQNHPRPDQDPDVEILRVTAIDTGTNDLTVTRAQETTTAASHPSGSAIHLSPTAKMFGDIEDTFADFWDASAQELTADVNNGSVSTESLIIGGTLYEEDANSPLDVTNQASATYTVAGDYESLIVISDPSLTGYDTLQVNGITASDYDETDNSDTETTGNSTFSLQRSPNRMWFMLNDHGGLDRIGYACQPMVSGTGRVIYGSLNNATGSGISQFTLSDGAGSNRDTFCRVFGRSSR